MDVIAVVGVVLAAAGIALAIRAERVAKASRQLAERANQLSTESRNLAAESKRLAVEANELSEEANTLSRRTEARETERDDVVWEADWPAPGRYVLTNRGQDEAVRVRATIDVDGEELVAAAERVGPGGTLTLNFPRSLQERTRRAEELRRKLDPEPTLADTWRVRVPYYHLPQSDWQLESGRITWETPLGQHRARDLQVSPTDLGVPDPD